ncbi:MAG: pyridoxamine 5'-phosphate oxidase family protein [Anaerolineales bacterium]|nr:pyridoxamine 5'-phosphate oxidase family protein [Anaerolineales bacterium]
MLNSTQLSRQNNLVPQPGRPHIPDYGIPASIEGTLPWNHVEERMTKARNYWVGTVGPEGRPHVVPTWGVWVEGTLYFGGGPDTRWSRNLAANPHVAVHLESGDDVVILEGTVGRITDPTQPIVTRIDDAYEAKYQMRHGVPFWVLRPRVAFAWSRFPDNATRWRFEAVE